MPNPLNAANPAAHRETNPDAAPARPAKKTLIEGEKHDHLKKDDGETEAEDRQEALIDEGVEETFPASDPVSVKRIT